MGPDPDNYAFDLTLKRLTDEAGRILGLIGVVEDITEKRRLAAQLIQARKMEAIGTIAGGIAHDFNNLLMGVMGNTTLILERISLLRALVSKIDAQTGIEKRQFPQPAGEDVIMKFNIPKDVITGDKCDFGTIAIRFTARGQVIHRYAFFVPLPPN